MSQVIRVRRRAIFLLPVAVAIVASVPVASRAQEAVAIVPEAPRGANDNAAPKFYSNYQTLINAYPGYLPIEQGREYVGTSLLPFGSRDKAIAEAREYALKSPHKVFLLVYDREERTQGLVSGISRVIKLRGVELLERTPDNVMKQLERPTPKELHPILAAALEKPEFAPHVARMKTLVQQDHDTLLSGVSVGALVHAVAVHEGRESTDNLKKWAKYHRGDSVRVVSLLHLIDLGELAFVEEAVKDEANRLNRYRVEEKLRKLRLGA